VSRNVKIVVLTGALGSGKSTVAEIFSAHGVPVIDADILARETVAPGSIGLKAVITAFGEKYLLTDGTLDRKALGKLVFTDPAARKTLEDITHPLIRSLHRHKIEALKNSEIPPQMVLCVIPLFFESREHYSEVDNVIVVSAPRETSIERVMKRDNCTRELAEKKYDSQIPLAVKEKRADFIITNDGDLKSLREKSELVFKKISKSQ
jgi:dephospho-CoA kinase